MNFMFYGRNVVIEFEIRQFRSVKILDLNQHLAGRDLRETLGGPDLDPNKSTGHINSCHRRKVEKAKGHPHLKKGNYSFA